MRVHLGAGDLPADESEPAMVDEGVVELQEQSVIVEEPQVTVEEFLRADQVAEGYATSAPAVNDLEEEEKQCWVCFASEEDDPDADWTHPCQ